MGLNLDEEVWDATTFTKNRDRLLEADVAKRFLAEVVELARKKDFVSDEHFTVDGTLLEAWASTKSFQLKEGKQAPAPDDSGNPTVNFRGQPRSNQTHESKTDPEARLARKHQPAKTEADRRMFRLAEDGRAAAEGATSRPGEGGLGVRLRLRDLQSGAHAKSCDSAGVGRGPSISAGSEK